MSKLNIVTKLDYNNGENIVHKGHFRISASGISRFFSSTNQWFRENLLGESGFISNSASVTGTVTHYILEQFAKNQAISADDKEQIANYILKHTNPDYEDYNPDIDINYIETNYKPMSEEVVNEYLIHNMPTHVEMFIAHEVLPGIMVGGSIDNLTLESPQYNGEPIFENLISSAGGVVVDYKTTSMRPSSLPDTIPFPYRLQALTYAWVLKQRGITIDRIRIVYVTQHDVNRISEKTGKPLQSYPSTVKVLTEQINDEDFDYIEGIINVIAHSVHRWNTCPADRFLLAQDYRLREI